MKKSLLVFLLIIVVSQAAYSKAYASSLNKDSAEKLVMDMYAVLSTQDAAKIKRFFSYYADTEARFIYQITGVDSTLPDKTERGIINRSREEYIAYLIRISKSVLSINYQAKVDSFKLAEDGLSAVVSISVDESSITVIPDRTQRGKNQRVKAKAATNCNISLLRAVATPIISGMNCIEKIIIK
ncbi:hypothetical protein I862_03405 [endosymbiont of Acanthamoeba sp. UWC8]|uniref:hypothetical protein n=1 Tax=endosymbiont of Acanthamoeba sp. UWC8 TaxID=86106 RepID=UPI0004D1CCA1|nr:hypothetical protein [endosymbiont of Acanthamoeba sp. UWC8]AIF81241.1 hypothetical protein I862_03405 [endosymbiont of Acanthamoeba sp. UWC8]